MKSLKLRHILQEIHSSRKVNLDSFKTSRNGSLLYCKDIFSNQPADVSDQDLNNILEKIQDLDPEQFLLDQPIETVPVNKIIPQQEMVQKNKLQSILDNGTKLNNYNDVTFAKTKNKYYLIDGHHRVSAKILLGNTSVKGHVFDYDNY